MKSILEAPDLKGKRVLVRVDWSVPVQHGKVLDDYQIRKSLPTIEYLQKAGAKITLISHAEKDDESLLPMFQCAKEFLPLTFVELSDMVLLENLRQNAGEKGNSEAYAKKLAALGDIYVNEAFGVSHREHASVVGVPKFLPSYVGLRFIEEVERLSSVFYPKRPFLFILGGAKFDTKLPLLEKFIQIADHIFVVGALAHNFFKAKNMEIGHSLVSESDFNLIEKLSNDKVHLPVDMLVKRGGRTHIDVPTNLESEDVIMDAGPNTILELKDIITHSSSVLWNGPLGYYELGYKQYTMELAKILAESGKETIIGGGDTLAVIKELNLYDKFSFVSTGGGAMLGFLAKGTLPGIEALK